MKIGQVIQKKGTSDIKIKEVDFQWHEKIK